MELADEMAQKIKTPPIEPCAICGASAKSIDWYFRSRYRVICDNNHTATGEFNTVHRAICRWNNAQKKIAEQVERECCGTLHGSAHRNTCPRKMPNCLK